MEVEISETFVFNSLLTQVTAEDSCVNDRTYSQKVDMLGEVKNMDSYRHVMLWSIWQEEVCM
jgi:hypothetical protein